MSMNEKDLFFIGFISNKGEKIEANGIWFNHTKLAEKIVADDPILKEKMSKSRHYIAIDFLVYEMGYLKIGNKKNPKSILYSVKGARSKVAKDWILIYEGMGYEVLKV